MKQLIIFLIVKLLHKMIEGPFKLWQITVEFDEIDEKKTKTSITVDYEMPMGPLGGFIDKIKIKKDCRKRNGKWIISGKSIVGRNWFNSSLYYIRSL